MAHCRIGRVKWKNVLQLPVVNRDDVQRGLVETAHSFAAQHKPGEMAGFIIIAWSEDLTIAQVTIDRAGIVHASTAPAFAAEEVRRSLHHQGVW